MLFCTVATQWSFTKHQRFHTFHADALQQEHSKQYRFSHDPLKWHQRSPTAWQSSLTSPRAAPCTPPRRSLLAMSLPSSRLCCCSPRSPTSRASAPFACAPARRGPARAAAPPTTATRDARRPRGRPAGTTSSAPRWRTPSSRPRSGARFPPPCARWSRCC